MQETGGVPASAGTPSRCAAADPLNFRARAHRGIKICERKTHSGCIFIQSELATMVTLEDVKDMKVPVRDLARVGSDVAILGC